MVWSEYEYEDEVFLYDGNTRQPDEYGFNQDLFNWYKKLIHIRRNNKILQLGSLEIVFFDDKKDVFIFEREYQQSSIIIAINNSNINQNISAILLLLHR